MNYSFFTPLNACFLHNLHVNLCIGWLHSKDPSIFNLGLRVVFFLFLFLLFNWDSLVMDKDLKLFTRWVPGLAITICNKITVILGKLTLIHSQSFAIQRPFSIPQNTPANGYVECSCQKTAHWINQIMNNLKFFPLHGIIFGKQNFQEWKKNHLIAWDKLIFLFGQTRMWWPWEHY